MNLRYDSFDRAQRDAQALLHFAPDSIETIDSTVLGLAQGDVIWYSVSAFFPEDNGERARGVNMVEVLGDTEAALGRLIAGLQMEGHGAGRRGFTIARQDDVAAPMAACYGASTAKACGRSSRRASSARSTRRCTDQVGFRSWQPVQSR